ncbi:polyketide synthase [Candidatus Albibeggiatoa sp. nov. NOAA]|uniref:polyketide synthase n=1 Tax=Candidatus Albibeggiatoa sp. nov. NOAA TaxID=3162724 RepID=UPI0033040EE3|nr:polyketide synthase [Thiotrichaceae bacterium]
MIRLEKGEDGIYFLKMEDHAHKNALDNTIFLDQLSKITTELKADLAAKVVILTGLKDVFSSGGNIDFLEKQLAEHYENYIEHEYANKMKTLLNIPIPVIAAMEGSATGGGLTLAFYTDIIIAAEESRYGFSFMNMGFTPGMGTTALAVEAFGYYTGFEMMATGNYKKGRELKGKCQFNYILPKAEVLPKAIDIAQAIAEKPRTSLELLKKSSSIKRRQMLEETSTIEAFMHKIAFSQPDIKNIIEDNYTG